MDFLWTLFHPLVLLLQRCLEMSYQFLAGVGMPSYGAAIILLTVVIKVVMYPLTVKQIKSMKAMQDLQPQMKRMQEQFKGNPQAMQDAMMRLYREKGINPMSGCLPLLIQMPILMAIYYALRDMDYAGSEAFLWLPSLAQPDPLYILPLLSAASTYLVSKQTMSSGGGMDQMKMMTYAMPLLIGWMSLKFASGLVLYWVVMNAVQIAQQWWMFRHDGKAQEAVLVTRKDKKRDKKNRKGESV